MLGTPAASPGSNLQPGKLQIALRWLAAGVSPLPIVRGTKRAAVPWLVYQSGLPSPARVRSWFERGAYELALVCGGPAGLVVLDFDDGARFAEWRASCDVTTRTIKTPRGFHAYLLASDARSFDLPGVEVRGPGRYVLCPPSKHPNGAPYEVFDAAPVARIARLSQVLPACEPTQIPGAPLTAPSTVGAVRDVKSRLSLLDEVRRFVELRSSDGGAGRWYAGRCPFHDDRHPSLWIDAERGRFGCRAPSCAAHRSGDVLDFLALARGVTVRDVIGGAL